MVYTEDARGLERALHDHFDQRRVNRVNLRREFFRVDLEEVANAVTRLHSQPIEVTRISRAEEYDETLAIQRAAAASSSVAAAQEPVAASA